MFSKEARHNYILDAISGTPISNQAELVANLIAAGFSVTQASISRDLHELGIAKREGRYARERTASAAYGPISLRTSGDSLLVLRCLPGIASAIAVEIDRANIPEIAGTLAGDDTIFIAASTSADRSQIAARFRLLFGGIDEQ